MLKDCPVCGKENAFWNNVLVHDRGESKVKEMWFVKCMKCGLRRLYDK